MVEVKVLTWHSSQHLSLKVNMGEFNSVIDYKYHLESLSAIPAPVINCIISH